MDINNLRVFNVICNIGLTEADFEAVEQEVKHTERTGLAIKVVKDLFFIGVSHDNKHEIIVNPIGRIIKGLNNQFFSKSMQILSLSSSEKIYCAINPRDLMMDIGEEIKGLDNEITLLESEEPEFIREEILEEPKILETDYEITDAISNLISKEYEIEFYYDGFSIKQNDMIFKRLVKRFSLSPIKGTFSAVFATKKGERIFPYVAIVFSINHKINKKNSTVIGCKIVNPEISKCLKGGVRSG